MSRAIRMIGEYVEHTNKQPTKADLLNELYNPKPGEMQALSDEIDRLLADGKIVERVVDGYGKRLAIPVQRMAPFYFEGGQYNDSGVA